MKFKKGDKVLAVVPLIRCGNVLGELKLICVVIFVSEFGTYIIQSECGSKICVTADQVEKLEDR
jgi:hypothetical protein